MAGYPGDASYGLYYLFNDLSPNESAKITWFYAAGPVDVILDVVEQVGEAAGQEVPLREDPAPEPEVEQPQPDPEPEPYRPYIPPRLRMDIVGLEPNQETVIIDVHTPFELPSGIVVYENDGRPFPIQNIEIFGEVNPNVLGTYRVEYLYRHHDRGVIRRINFRVVDRIRPEATYEIESVYLGDEWVDDIVITDNY